MMRTDKRRNSSIKSALTKRIAVYTLLFFVLSVIECSFLGRIEILPASPDLLIAAVAAIAVIDRHEGTLVSAIIAGIMIDAIGGVGIYLSPLVYFVIALLITLIAKKMMTSYLSYLAILPIVCLLRAAATIGEAYIYRQGYSIVEILKYAVLPEAICTLIFALPLYPLVALCAKIMTKQKRLKIEN